MAEPTSGTPADVPVVAYLVLDDESGGYLRAHECLGCGARYVERRNGCGRCGADRFGTVRLADTGTVRSATSIHRSAPGIAVPYTSVVVDLDGGGAVKASYVGAADRSIESLLGQAVELTLRVVGTDDTGNRAIGFGFVDATAVRDETSEPGSTDDD